MSYKSILTKLTVVFVAIVVFLTFFSRTLMDMHVPRVSVAFIQSGIINQEALSHGTVRHADSELIFAPASGRITQIVEVGDALNRQTVLFTISSDIQNLTTMLTQAEHDLSINRLNIERVRSEQTAEQQRLTQMLTEPAPTLTAPILRLWDYDMQLESNTNDVARVNEDLISLEILYEEGIIPRQNIIDRENELVRLAQSREQIYQRRDLAIQNHEAAMEAYEVSAANQDRIREAQIQSQRERITQIGFTLNMHLLETGRINNRISELLEQIEAGGMVEVQLDEDAFANQTVSELMPGISVGMNVMEGAPVMRTVLRNSRFVVEASFRQADDFVAVGRTAEIAIADNRLEGRVSRVIQDGLWQIATIEISSAQPSGGEFATVTVSGVRSNQSTVIPLSALRENSDGYFILYIEADTRGFGTNYYTRIHRVNPGLRDAESVAITSALQGTNLPSYPIIIQSDMPIWSANQRVRLVAGYDFEPTR